MTDKHRYPQEQDDRGCEECGAMDVKLALRPLYQSAPLSLCDECLETWANYEVWDRTVVFGTWRCEHTALTWRGDISEHHGIEPYCPGPHLRAT